MRIVIAGAGEVGSHLATMLGEGAHEITVIDSDPKLLENVTNISDVVAVEGDCTTFAVLKRAAVRKADLFIAVNREESPNIISAMLAKQLGARKTIARIDNNEYLEPNNKEVFINMGIDYLFYPEKIAALEVVNLLGHSSTTDYVDFSGGKLALSVFKLDQGSPFVNRKVEEITSEVVGVPFRTVAIAREEQTIIPHGGDVYRVGDIIYIISNVVDTSRVVEFCGMTDIDVENVMILGGSKVGVRIALELQNRINVKLIEYNAEKAYRLAELLDDTLIINEDGRDLEAMLEEGLQSMDAFVAVTARSETNILAAMLAKRMGVKKVIAEVENLNYINLAESIGIDTIINKKMVTASNIFRFTMDTDVQAIRCLRGSQAEVLEFIVKPNSPATKSTVANLGFPAGATIGGVVRADNVFLVGGNTQINAYDRVVVFALPSAISKIGRFFN
ncbi:MAG: Trk system potassium transporter TrkA [Tidjanibacter sp.]|nr:Trk system potassium transporter TrkA [Tidjanibacter sp.]